MSRVALQLAVGEGSLLERPECLHSLVRLPEEAESEHCDDDDQQRRPHERDEQLGVNASRQAADSPDQRIAHGAQQPPRSGLCPLWRSVRFCHGSGLQLGCASDHPGDQPATVDPRDVHVCGGDRCHSLVFTST